MTMFLDIHVLQTVPPSNVNRDDTGSPKTARYGGVTRARVSSQAWKRATRQGFDGIVDLAERGTRTKRLVEILSGGMLKLNPNMDEVDAHARAELIVTSMGLKVEKPRKGGDDESKAALPTTQYLMFLSNHQLDRLAQLGVDAHDGKVKKADVKKIADSRHGVDVSLFGRMVADAADLNVDAAAQVAHAISTHEVATEVDYFTAVDDNNPEEESGAGMIGTIDFNSSTLYRYATLNVDGLAENVGDPVVTAEAVRAFLLSFTTSMPTGKQSTFAHGTLPDAVVVAVRSDLPINLVGAFEDPVRATEHGYVRESCARLATHMTELAKGMAEPADKCWVVLADDRGAALAQVGERFSLKSMTEEAAAAVAHYLGEQS